VGQKRPPEAILAATESPESQSEPDPADSNPDPPLPKSRKQSIAMAAHPETPRRHALRLIRSFYNADLMQFALRPTVAADLKQFAERQFIGRLPGMPLGERLTVARRASGGVAAALLLDKDARVSRAALDNARLTEAAVAKALPPSAASEAFVQSVRRHPKWSLRNEIRLALLRSPNTPAECALELARTIPQAILRDLLNTSDLPEKLKKYLRQTVEGKC
jgi:hypothetical protein